MKNSVKKKKGRLLTTFILIIALVMQIYLPMSVSGEESSVSEEVTQENLTEDMSTSSQETSIQMNEGDVVETFSPEDPAEKTVASQKSMDVAVPSSAEEESGTTAQLMSLDENVTAIYLNGASGDDANDGSSKEKAVKTFTKAKELATTYKGINTIYITGTVPVSGEISLDGTNAILKREASFNGNLINVASGTTATLKNIVVDGNSEEATGANKSLVNCSGILNITEGTVLQNNKIASRTARRTGGAVYSSRGVINMTAGVIQNNTAMSGGGIMLCNNAKLDMSGGTIQNNQAISGPTPWNDAAAGGGVCLSDGATFNLSGTALIQNNSSEEVGGGISVGTIEVSFGHNKLNMSGGVVDGNTANATGGGIFIQGPYGGRESVGKITAGSITNNEMLGKGQTNFAFGGGGIYVNGFDYPGFGNGQLFLENVVVTDNEAKIEGGGYAGCPISNTKIYLKDGGAFYGNKADDGARDIYILSDSNEANWGAHAGNPEYFVSNIMLGCVPYCWKDNDGNEVPLNKLAGRLTGDGVSLDLNTDSVGNAETDNLAKVFISGNYSATRGGGIGTNGSVTIGTKDPTVEIKVDKVWDDENNEANIRPDTVTVELWCKIKDSSDDPVYVGHETITSDENGDWSMTFTDLPETDGQGNVYEYSIKERNIPGYVGRITGNATEGFKIANVIAITVEGEKTWKDGDNQDGKRPESITIRLLKNETEIDSKVVTEADDWKWKFESLPEKDEDGKLIAYTIAEDAVAGYSTEISGYNVTNTHMPSKTSVQVTKVWDDADNQDGIRPESVTIKLFADGEDTGETITLTSEGNWTGTFGALDEYKAGEKIAYTIEEVTVKGYTSFISGDAEKGFVITNCHDPSKSSKPMEPSNPKEPEAPKTGDDSETALWLSGMFLSAGILFLLSKKRKEG